MTCIKNTTRGCCFSTDANGEAEARNCPGCHKLEVFDWMADLPNPLADNQIFEIQFKNTRKGYYWNNTGLALKAGDIVAVEASPGHDIGIVTLSGELVAKQMKRTGFNPQGVEFKKIYRKAKPYDIEKWQEAISLEHSTMIRSRQIAADLHLNMKIGDVEYQGDKLKAIFYYIADERVDFRELIKVLAEQFRIRVEMRQIGARQEAGRIGGIAACGRELCCSTWINNFSSVTIGAARHQEISLNPQKLAGQCGKLKCCLNYELDSYIDARRAFPRLNGPLEAMDGSYHLVKSDIFRKIMWFSPDAQSTAVMIPLTTERVRQIVAMNRRGEKVDRMEDAALIAAQQQVPAEPEIKNVVGEESITRFDTSRGGRNRGGRNNRNGGNRRGGNSGRGNRDGEAKSRENAGGNNHTAHPEQMQKPNDKSEQRPTARPELAENDDRSRGSNNNRRGGSSRSGNHNGNRGPRRSRPGGNSGSGNTNPGGSHGGEQA
ncbi:regulatory iron-sulfur-containing complex subunit RicT [uncultured Rikenella sp.]|uniref:regulatory iron-sulfur-containing complex subunit RicT n=1 Tax=uncultured Rikenella sp. TaxID=368003 RepID=UPI002626E836|nr:regulatory iron-sulfur-containing complex subunit RicT [uncultured Rikenella sp.]